MRQAEFFSLRFGFTHKQAEWIKKFGIKELIQKSFKTPDTEPVPEWMEGAPKSLKEYMQVRKMSEEQKKELVKEERRRSILLQHWWIERMYTVEFPLREKMILFWHNHFVSSYQKVKSSWLIYEQHALFRKHAFGNYKQLTREILYNNAMLIYLDNRDNKVGKINENLSRELLELFTLGTGNYSEKDIYEGARILAGLLPGDGRGMFRPALQDTGVKTYLGKTGNLSIEDMVEAIFNHPACGEVLVRKFLKAFGSDLPPESKVKEYTAYFRVSGFEIKALFEKLVSDSWLLEQQGNIIKSPISFLLQSAALFGFNRLPVIPVINWLREQGMEIGNPPNVKGWVGGKSWLSSQILIQRVALIDFMASPNGLEKWNKRDAQMNKMANQESLEKLPEFKIERKGFTLGVKVRNRTELLNELSEQLLLS